MLVRCINHNHYLRWGIFRWEQLIKGLVSVGNYHEVGCSVRNHSDGWLVEKALSVKPIYLFVHFNLVSGSNVFNK